MNIALKVSHLIAALGRERAIEVVPEIRHRHENQRVRLNVTDITTPEVDKIAKVAQTDNKALARRISAWRDLRAEPDKHIIKNAVQMETALIAFVMKCPHKILFHRAEDGQLLPWFVRSVSYTPKRIERHRGETHITPAYASIHLEAFKGEEKVSKSESWHDAHPKWGGGDFQSRRSVTDLLEIEDIVPEKVTSYDRYLKELARFHELYTQTGAQFNASGRCYGDAEDEWDYGSRKKKKRNRRSSGNGLRSLTKDGQPSRVVIDMQGDEEPDEEDDSAVDEGTSEYKFWTKFDALAGKTEEEIKTAMQGHKKTKVVEVPDDDDDAPVDDDDAGLEADEDEDDKSKEDEEDEEPEVVLPVHPYLQVFDFATDSYVTCHINCLEEYKFAVDIEKKLILPDSTKKLVTVLISTARNVREDIVAGKTGGVIVASTGEPGTGKTLTAEVFAEQMKIPIYMVQCSQLGTTSSDLESKLIVVLKRAMRWSALLLLDEADVYIRARGDDIEQNAIVGVFLRLLERFRGILFMTSNRATALDDAILSRCIAHIRYDLPNAENSALIWEVLSENYKVDLFPKEIKRLVELFPFISGRNIKTLLKLATSVSSTKEFKKGELSDLIVEMAQFVDFPKAHHEAKKAKKEDKS